MSAAATLNEGIRCAPAPNCIGCGGEGRIIHRDLRDVLFGAPGVWNLRRCSDRGCGLAWIDPMPHPDDVGKFYQTYYTHVAVEVPVGLPPASRNLRQRARGLVGRMLPGPRVQFEPELMHFGSMPPGRILDVGCGSGKFLAKASAAGWQVLGIDFDEQAVARARRISGVDARVMDVFDPSLDHERFDGIAMDNVIEHLADPARIFERCHELLAPGGRVVMVTPNIDGQCHALFGAAWRGLEPPRHLYLYGASALRRFASDAGLVDVSAFCLFNGGEIDFMIENSEEVARKAALPMPEFDRRRLKLRNAVSAILGRTIGEWVTLVAHKARD